MADVNDRRLVMLSQEFAAEWMDPADAEVAHRTNHAHGRTFEWFRVSTDAGDVRNQRDS
jgi:putative SOS response-associated peptidase YedK